MRSLVRFLSSVKLGIVLIIVITIASLLGTFFPQGRGMEEYTLRYGQLAGLLDRLEIFHLYQSFWYIGLLILFSLNILVCTLTRISNKMKRAFAPQLESEPKKLAALKINETFETRRNAEHAREEFKKELKRRRFRIRESSGKDGLYLLARKKTGGFFGSDVVHLGLLIILAGGIISGLGRKESYLQLSEGDVRSVRSAGFDIRLGKFEIELYDNGQVKDWKSTLTILENGKEQQTKIVEVNHPLSYKGFMFYQSSWGWDWRKPMLEIWAKQENTGNSIGKVRLRLGERAEFSGSGLQITALQFEPDFVVVENGVITSRSNQPNNPAVKIECRQGETQIFSGWIFAKFPDFSDLHSGKETDLSFELRDYRAGLISVIQAAKDPGANLIWTGCAIVMLGLAAAFYWPPREIKVIIQSRKDKTKIFAGGIASKNKETFQAEFKKIMTALRIPR